MRRFPASIRQIAYKYNIGLNEAEKYVRKARQQAVSANLATTDQILMGLVDRLIRTDKISKNRKPENF